MKKPALVAGFFMLNKTTKASAKAKLVSGIYPTQTQQREQSVG